MRSFAYAYIGGNPGVPSVAGDKHPLYNTAPGRRVATHNAGAHWVVARQRVVFSRVTRTQATATHVVVDEEELRQFETNLHGHSRLDPELKHVDLRLQLWAPWARPHYGQMGWPTRSVTEKANEGGLLAKDISVMHAPEWPTEIVVTDAQVARLPTRHQAAVMANYFHLSCQWRVRAQVYAGLVKYLGRTRPQALLVMRAVGPAACGPDAFRRDLDRARWALKAVLGL